MNRSNHPAAVRDGGSEQPEWREKEDTESLTSDDEGWTPLPSELHPPLALEVEKLFRRRAHHHHPASSSSSNETYNKSQPTPREGDETEQKPATETPPIQPPSGGKHCDQSFGSVYRELPVIDHPPLILPSNWLEDSPTTDHLGGDEFLAVDDSKSDDDMADFTVTFRRSGSTQRHASVSYHSSTPSERIYRQPRCRRLPPRRGTEEIYGNSSASTRVAHVSTRHKRERDRVQKSSRRKHQHREEPSSSCVPPDNGVFQNALMPPPPPPPPPPPLPLASILEEDDGCSMDWMEDDLYPEALQVE